MMTIFKKTSDYDVTEAVVLCGNLRVPNTHICIKSKSVPISWPWGIECD